MSIRAARTDELPRLREIERAAGRSFRDIGMPEIADGEPLPQDELARYRRDGVALVAAGPDGLPMAYLVAEPVDGALHVEQVSVHPDGARRGTGRALLDHAAGLAAAQGLTALTLTTFADVPWNAPYYRRLGFRLLEEHELGPGLREIRRLEAAHGLDRWTRVCLRREVAGAGRPDGTPWARGVDCTGPVWANSALLLIDVQQDFLDGGALTIPGTTAVLPRLAELVAAYRAAGRPVVHIVRLSEPGSGDVDLPRRAAVEAGLSLAVPGTPGSQLAPAVLGERMAELDPELLLAGKPQYLDGSRTEAVLFKPRWGAFHRTGLEQLLRDRGVDTVVVAGCNLPNCPRATLFEAGMRDLRTVLVTDAVSRTSDERIADLAAIGVRPATTAEVVAALG